LESEFDDSMTMSTNSASEDDENNRSAWAERLQDRVSQLLSSNSSDRKRMGISDRENILRAYLHLVRHYYANSELGGRFSDIVQALMKSARSGGSALEQSTALQALSVTILTCPSETVFETVMSPLKVVIDDAEDHGVKAHAIYALTVASLYGDGSIHAAEAILEYLIEIIESDGEIVNAFDSGPVVAAAMHGWGFIASHLADLSEQSEQAMDAFVDQLDSSDVDVQTGAGSNIALLFESAREYEEESGETLPLRYDPKKLIRQMKEISRGSKSISKKDRRHLRTDFSSIITSLELGKGPGYSTSGRPAVNPHLGGSNPDGEESEIQEFGYREKIRVHNVYITINSWALSAKVEVLKALLAGGFATHFSDNPVVHECLESAEIERIVNPNLLRKEFLAEKRRDASGSGRRVRS